MDWWDYPIIVGLQGIVTWAVWYFASYVKEKGKNLATREDIGGITRQIESVKTENAKELEGLKSELNARFFAHTMRFEKEFHVYEEIWKALLELRNATMKLRPVGDFIDPNETDEERKRKRLERFGKAFDAFYPVVYENRPFLPSEVFNRLEESLKVMNSEASDYVRRRDEPDQPRYDPKYWEKAEANAEKILKQTDAICEAIRRRIEML